MFLTPSINILSTHQGALEAGIHRTCHAAEMGPARNVRIAVETLNAERIGHGYHIVDDDDVFKVKMRFIRWKIVFAYEINLLGSRHSYTVYLIRHM